MANTYTQIYIHIVFAVDGRQALIAPEHNDELQKYITGIVRAQRHKLIAINNMPDHLHLLIGMRPDASLSPLVRDIKANSSRFINEHRWVTGRFSWQEGFGAFSYFPLRTLGRDSLHRKPTATSRQNFIPNRIRQPAQELRCGIRPAVSFQAVRGIGTGTMPPMNGAQFPPGRGLLQ
jgi:putative transposase